MAEYQPDPENPDEAAAEAHRQSTEGLSKSRGTLDDFDGTESDAKQVRSSLVEDPAEAEGAAPIDG